MSVESHLVERVDRIYEAMFEGNGDSVVTRLRLTSAAVADMKPKVDDFSRHLSTVKGVRLAAGAVVGVVLLVLSWFAGRHWGLEDEVSALRLDHERLSMKVHEEK